jgi:protein-S-isoprenylcysteine O-methyltransferase Ste14
MIGMLLLSWGWDDWRGFLSDRIRAGITAIITLRFFLMAFWGHPNTAGKGRPDKHLFEPFFFVLLYAAVLGLLASPYFDRRDFWVLPGKDGIRFVGLLLFASGITFASWAQFHLGQFFSGYVTLQENHQLVTDGPFAWIRHPRYASLLLVFAGLALAFRSVVGLLASLVCAALYLWRIRQEEALLAGEFYEEWERYAARTKRIIPGVW